MPANGGETSQESVIDLGCGPAKVPGAFGVDHHPYEGVDQVLSLDETPWPLDDSGYDRIYARHVIEHLADVPSFMNEVHRIGKPGAILEVVTPHFSSIDSYKDPTHRWHLATTWYEVFTQSYLSEQMADFEHLESELTFGKSLRSILPKLMIRLKGRTWWEKHYAFTYPARNITTRLRIVKS